MKNVLLGLVLAFAVVSCGPSAKQIEETRVLDSIRMADSTAMVQAAQQKIADSIALVAKADSTKKADSAKLSKVKHVKNVKKVVKK